MRSSFILTKVSTTDLFFIFPEQENVLQKIAENSCLI